MTTISDAEGAIAISGNDDTVNVTSSGSLNPSDDANTVSFTSASYGYLFNAGQIVSQEYAISIDSGSANAYIANQASGLIAGYRGISNAGAITIIHNSGMIDSQTNGISNSGSSFVVQNSGQISAVEIGIFTAAANSVIVNSGTISSDTSQSVYAGVGAGALSITNTGTMIGDILDLGGNATIRNSGLIQGNVQFGYGTNSFDGRHGSVTGTITGGSGADTIRLGNDGETVNGGAGHDVLYGGRGEDTFAFSSYASADNDVIHKFSVADDTIQLDHTVFTKLKAGQAPEFSIGTTASDATDYLYYDPNSGNLYYDTNGSAAGGSHLIATLDPHLMLTQSNFDIV